MSFQGLRCSFCERNVYAGDRCIYHILELYKSTQKPNRYCQIMCATPMCSNIVREENAICLDCADRILINNAQVHTTQIPQRTIIIDADSFRRLYPCINPNCPAVGVMYSRPLLCNRCNF